MTSSKSVCRRSPRFMLSRSFSQCCFSWRSLIKILDDGTNVALLLNSLLKKLSKISDPTHGMPSNVTVSYANCARNLGVICNSSRTMLDHNSSVYIICFFSFMTLERIRTLIISLLHTLLQTSVTLNSPPAVPAVSAWQFWCIGSGDN